MTYLELCQEKITELHQLIADLHTIQDNTIISERDKYHLVFAEGCYGRIAVLFGELQVPFTPDNLECRFFSYTECLGHLVDYLDARQESLKALLVFAVDKSSEFETATG